MYKRGIIKGLAIASFLKLKMTREKKTGGSGGHANARRRQFIQLQNSTDQYWVKVLGDNLFHDLNYYDLFTQMWLRLNGTSPHIFQKSELYPLMPNVSQRTAVKYVQIAIDHGLLIEHINPEDLRSRLITMSTGLERKIELFLDYSISVFETFPLADSGRPVGKTDDKTHAFNAPKARRPV